MPPRPKSSGRFSRVRISRRIYAEMLQRGLLHKQMAGVLDISPGQWSDKFHAKVGENSFQLEEYEIIANYFEAPPGWPFIDWKDAEKLRKPPSHVAESADKA